MSPVKPEIESVAVSTRIRLARNFLDYPFPALLMRDKHAEEQASEMVSLIAAELGAMDDFTLYDMSKLSSEDAAYLAERNLISRDLLRHKSISAALIVPDGSMSVMINEEDHIREQCFMRGLDLKRAYERISGIDERISDTIPFAYDKMFGYLTACPTNLGTGMRASVMLFLPAMARRGAMPAVSRTLTSQGLTVRGALGEGSESEGDLYQVSNEITLGRSEEQILSSVDSAVQIVAETELRERECMLAEEGVALKDRVMRAYGILSHCLKIGRQEFMRRMADLKLGVSLGLFAPPKDGRRSRQMAALDGLIVEMRPANINRLNGRQLSEEEGDIFRAKHTAERIRAMKLT